MLARPVAVHTFTPDFPRLDEVVTAARAASRLTDPRLTQVFDAAEDDGHSYVVSEWVTGETLADLLAARPARPRAGRRRWSPRPPRRWPTPTRPTSPTSACTPEHLVWTAGSTVKLLGLGSTPRWPA